MPRRIANAELSASDVYRKVSDSIFIVFAAATVDELRKDRPRGASLGSAVAVSTSHLVTNCHVVEGRPAIALVQGEEVGRAILFRANPNRDQCFLQSLDIALKPVEGVRRFVDLIPGEQVYSIGAPRGQELTIAGGLISGLRVLDEGNHVQTSAPISPGSSGGGLFDDHGNLIGITTFLLRDAQNLNFAIAADEFWR
jgi:serine protease Do